MAKLVDLPSKPKKKKSVDNIIEDFISGIKSESISDIDRILAPWQQAVKKIDDSVFHIEKFCIDNPDDKIEFEMLMNRIKKEPDKFLDLTIKDYFSKDGLYFVVVQYYEVKEGNDADSE